MSLTYKQPLPIKKPFERGQLVEVCDRHLYVMETVKVVYCGPRIVRLADGRRFRATDGWAMGDHPWESYPFPSIRHAPDRSEP